LAAVADLEETKALMVFLVVLVEALGLTRSLGLEELEQLTRDLLVDQVLLTL
jgi:hypothetical protein